MLFNKHIMPSHRHILAGGDINSIISTFYPGIKGPAPPRTGEGMRRVGMVQFLFYYFPLVDFNDFQLGGWSVVYASPGRGIIHLKLF